MDFDLNKLTAPEREALLKAVTGIHEANNDQGNTMEGILSKKCANLFARILKKVTS